MFSILSQQESIVKATIKLWPANALKLVKSKILSFGKELNNRMFTSQVLGLFEISLLHTTLNGPATTRFGRVCDHLLNFLVFRTTCHTFGGYS